MNSKITRFKTKGCRNYDQLGIIFDRSTATGILRRSSAQCPPNSDDEANLMHRMQTEGIHVYKGGVGPRGQPDGFPSQTFVDLDSPHDNEIGGPSVGGSRRSGKEPMEEDSRGSGNDRARDIGLGVSMGSSGKGSSGKNSSRRSKVMIDATKQSMYEELRDMARARKEALLRQSQPVEYSSQLHSTGKSAHPINQAMDLLDELQGEITDDVYVAACFALLDEKMQNIFVRMNVARRRIWLSKLKP